MEPLNLTEYESLARERLPLAVYDYYAGGADDEVTLRMCLEGWERMRLRPRMLVDVSRRDLSTSVLGVPVTMPVLAAPCALNGLAHPGAEAAVARAVGAAGTLQIVSTGSSLTLEEIRAASSGPQWFQLYCSRDRSVTADLVARAEQSGYGAFVLTVDVQLLGRRERDTRNQFASTDGITWGNLDRYAGQLDPIRGAASGDRDAHRSWDTSLSWKSLEWLRGITRLPIVLKGILTGEDGRLAVEHGVAGVVVSNHGGRQLDGAVPACDALREVVEAVDGCAEVYVDGGVRRGTHVLKALALGARAVLIGRPYLWGLAVDGEAGVRRVLELLRTELDLAMALSGRPDIASIDRRLVV